MQSGLRQQLATARRVVLRMPPVLLGGLCDAKRLLGVYRRSQSSEHCNPARMFMKAKLDLLATCLLIVTCLAVLGNLAYERFALQLHSGSVSSLAIQPSGVLDTVGDLEWSASERTLLLAFSSRCRFCTESLPFYKRLSESDLGSTRLVAVTREPAESGKEFFRDADVDVPVISRADLSKLRVVSTPTLVLVDNSGVILDAWRGKLTADQEESVLTSLL